MLLSAEPAYEFPDWGNRAHVRGGSHGSLHRVDSLGALLFCGVDVAAPSARTATGRSPTSRRWSSATSALRNLSGMPVDEAVADTAIDPPRLRGQARARARAAQAGQLVAARALRRPSARAATSSTSPSSRRPCTARGSTRGSPRRRAFIVALSNNFVWNRLWTFRAGEGHAGFQAARFCVVSLAAFGFNLVVLYALVDGLGVAEVPAQAIAIASATPLNFIGNKLWSFKA